MCGSSKFRKGPALLPFFVIKLLYKGDRGLIYFSMEAQARRTNKTQYTTKSGPMTVQH